jgi:DNA modification methylase
MVKIEVDKTELVWPGKYDENGQLKEVDRINLPFQIIETINSSRAEREKRKKIGVSLYDFFEEEEGETVEEGWKNKLIWGDNKIVMNSLLKKYASKIDLIYIDPPFATGADFRYKTQIGDSGDEIFKEHSMMEEKAFRDTWGKGIESYLSMMYERLPFMKELLSPKGSIYIHLDWRMTSFIRLIADEIFGSDNYNREIIWRMGWISGYKTMAKNWIRNHDNILFYVKDKDKFTFNKKWIPYPPDYERWGGRPKGKGLAIEDVWGIFPKEGVNSLSVISFAKENVGYPTQKSEGLLKRIIEVSSDEGDLIADFFCGSGTACVVAEKLGRRWIGCDLSRWGIHTTRKRLLDVENCTPFEVLNLGKYERQYWQDIHFKQEKDEHETSIFRYIAFILKLYGSEPISGTKYIHGKKGNAMIHVGSVDSPVTIDEINLCMEECLSLKQKELHVLGWEWEMGLNELMIKAAKSKGIKLVLLNIPREVMEKEAIQKGDIKFYELAYVKTDVKKLGEKKIKVELKDFAMANPDLIPEKVREKITKWSDYIDYWAIDWGFQNDTFLNGWVTYRTKKDRALKLVSDAHKYEKPGKYTVFVKVVDIFGNDTSIPYEVKVE